LTPGSQQNGHKEEGTKEEEKEEEELTRNNNNGVGKGKEEGKGRTEEPEEEGTNAEEDEERQMATDEQERRTSDLIRKQLTEIEKEIGRRMRNKNVKKVGTLFCWLINRGHQPGFSLISAMPGFSLYILFRFLLHLFLFPFFW
jgi:hypothetical protein